MLLLTSLVKGFSMNRDQQPRRWWKDNWLVLALVALIVVVAAITGLGYWLRWSWTGLVVMEDKDPTRAMQVEVANDPRLFWDWLALLIIPVVLGAGAVWFNQQTRKGEQQQRQNELDIAEQNRQEDILQRDLDTMQGLILDKGLRKSEKDAETRDVARARTLAVLRSLDSSRKGQVVRFLHEADLIGKVVEDSGERQVIEAIVDLRDADLREADLRIADLTLADLSNAILSGAILSNADLSYADLNAANLSNAILSNADLHGVHLNGANLSNAILWEADLRYANLRYADLSRAYLEHADLKGLLQPP